MLSSAKIQYPDALAPIRSVPHMSYETASEKLRRKKTQLISAFLNGEEKISFWENHARILDDYFCERFEKSMVGPSIAINKNPYAIIALGGYGRSEQCLHSDVDVLFLFKNNIPREAESLIREIIYPLWDIGLDIGYATRSLKDCIQLAGSDFEVLTSLMDARFICGMSLLYSELTEQIREKIIFRQSNKIIAWLVESNRKRHLHFGDATYLLEPNLKEGQGGLRDYHTMLWLSQIKFNLRYPRDLEYSGILSHDEFQALNTSLLFIWNVRSRLHYVVGRKYDQLHLEYQPQLADTLKYERTNGQQPVERFLGELHSRMELIKQKHLMLLYEFGAAKKWFNIKKKFAKQTRVNGLEIKKDMLNFSASEEIVKSPVLLIKIFEESVRLKIPLSIEARRLVKEFLYLVDKEFRTSKQIIKIFEYILALPAPTFNVLNEMLNTGFLVQFIPEMQSIINRIEYDEYHIFPVDKHSLRTVRTIKQFGTTEDPAADRLCGHLYQELFNKKLLLWAALLHDIGKGKSGENHSKTGADIARSILTEKGLEKEDIETVCFLIQEHLFLINTATRRDINDEETIISCARRIVGQTYLSVAIERLKMLYLLTVADFISTGPKAWNEWVAVLLRDLFFNVLKTLEKGELASHETIENLEKKKAECKTVLNSSGVLSRQIEMLFDVMPQRYLLYTSAQDISKHIMLYKNLGSAEFVWEIRKDADSDTRMISICAKDSPGLFSKIAGIFTLNNINILDAQIYTWQNHISLTIFRVTPPPDLVLEDEKWKQAEKQLHAALSDELNLTAALEKKFQIGTGVSSRSQNGKHRVLKKENQVIVDNNSSVFFTIIEVYTYDYPGLLFRITDALFKCNLNLHSAQVATKADQVVDVFYVKGPDGQKIDDPDHLAAIKSAIDGVLVVSRL